MVTSTHSSPALHYRVHPSVPAATKALPSLLNVDPCLRSVSLPNSSATPAPSSDNPGLWNPGDWIVWPNHGVAEVGEPIAMTIGDDEVQAYQLHFPDTDAVVYVPVERSGWDSARPLMSKDTAKKALQVLAEQEAPEKRATWNRRQRRYREALDSADPGAVAAVIGELYAVRAQKDGVLSFGERRLLEQAHAMFAGELVKVFGWTRKRADKQILDAAAS